MFIKDVAKVLEIRLGDPFGNFVVKIASGSGIYMCVSVCPSIFSMDWDECGDG